MTKHSRTSQAGIYYWQAPNHNPQTVESVWQSDDKRLMVILHTGKVTIARQDMYGSPTERYDSLADALADTERTDPPHYHKRVYCSHGLPPALCSQENEQTLAAFDRQYA